MNQKEFSVENVEVNLKEIIKQKEELDKKALRMEAILGSATLVSYIAIVMIVVSAQMQEEIKFIIISILTVYLFVVASILLKIEQIAGYYKCNKCNYTHVPNYSSVFLAMHVGRTRYMKCPKCGKWSWNKKVISKEAGNN